MSESILGGFMTVGETYILINRADPGRALNVWSNSRYPAANLSNVCLWTKDTNDTAQHWKLVKSGGHYLLKPVDNENVALDLYTGSGSGANCNAHLYTPSQTSWLTFELAADDRHIKIRLENTNKYLTANPNQNGTRTGTTSSAAGNVYFWQGGLTDGKQEWTPRRVGGGSSGSGQYLALPINNCSITAMYQDDSNPAYQHEWDSGGHFGLDMIGSPNPFYASGIGEVVGKGGTATTGVGYWVAIRYNNVYSWNMANDSRSIIPTIIVRYYHLASASALNAGDPVSLNTVIGTYGNTGKWHNSMGPHLHVEADTSIANALSTPTLTIPTGGLSAGNRASNCTTIDPCSVFFIKESTPECQNLSYSQSTCDVHPNSDEYYVNTIKMSRFMEQTFN